MALATCFRFSTALVAAGPVTGAEALPCSIIHDCCHTCNTILQLLLVLQLAYLYGDNNSFSGTLPSSWSQMQQASMQKLGFQHSLHSLLHVIRVDISYTSGNAYGRSVARLQD